MKDYLYIKKVKVYEINEWTGVDLFYYYVIDTYEKHVEICEWIGNNIKNKWRINQRLDYQFEKKEDAALLKLVWS